MKKIVICVLIILIILSGIYIGFTNLNKDEDTSNLNTSKEETNEEKFKKLIQYKTESVKDEENLYQLLKNMEHGEYLVDIKKEFDGEKEYITIYYDCVDENKVRQYFIEAMKLETLEKNTVTLFALIDKLEKVNYKFSVSDLEVAKKCSIHTLYSGALSIGYSERTREMIEKNYDQDVRNYVENPSEFMQYNMDLNINNITIYTIDYKSEGNEITTININDKTHIDNIIQDIESQNFEATVNVLNSICTTWVDLNNGYILGMVGEHQNKDYGIILKGKGEDVFTKTSINTDGYINKILPKGLIGYIDDIIKNSSTAN